MISARYLNYIYSALNDDDREFCVYMYFYLILEESSIEKFEIFNFRLGLKRMIINSRQEL